MRDVYIVYCERERGLQRQKMGMFAMGFELSFYVIVIR